MQVWQLSAREHVLLIVQHHSITDGVSLGIMARELAVAYSAAVQTTAPELPPLSVAYLDYAAWQREQLSGKVLDTELAWWHQTLADAPALLELPTDRPRPSSMTFAGAMHSCSAPAAVRQGLQQLAKSRQTTEFVVLLAALQVCLGNGSFLMSSLHTVPQPVDQLCIVFTYRQLAVQCRCCCTSTPHRRTSSWAPHMQTAT
jgi:Condensation domain